MQNINFESVSGQKIYDRYLKRVNRTIGILKSEDRKDVMMEINSHIFEGLQRSERDEVSHLLDLLDSLGEPEDFLQPLVAEKKLLEASKSFNPKLIFQAILLNISNGIRFILFALLYISLFGFGYMIFAKIFDPKHTGLFIKEGELFALGQVYGAENTHEVLGVWFIPFCILVCAISYFLITFMFR